MKAIQTKYLPPSNTTPARIKGSAEGVKSKTYSKNYLEDNSDGTEESLHALAARMFADSLNWPDPLVSGGLACGSWAHCFCPELTYARNQAEIFERQLDRTLR